MRTHAQTLLAILLAVPLAVAEAQEEKATPVRKDGRLVMWDAAVHGLAPIKNYTAGWIKGSDLTPVARMSATRGGKAVAFSFKGRGGTACSTIYFTRLPSPPEGKEYAGLELIVAYDKQDFGQITASANYWDGTALTKVITLQPGEHTYDFNTGFRRSGGSIDWKDLNYVMIHVKSRNLQYRLRRITMKERDARIRSKPLPVARRPKVHEVLPAAGTISLDGNISERAWAQAQPLSGFHHWRGAALGPDASPLAVRLAYSDTTLYLATQSRFPTAPVAEVKRQDMYVYNDEAQEIFFDAPGSGFIQFVINAAGTVFDAVNGSHMKNVTHKKGLRYANEQWAMELAFPLRELGVDPEAPRHMGFQIVQSYQGRKGSGLRTTVWEQTQRFPIPSTFGVLLFNRQPFGPGTIEVTGIERADNRGQAADIEVDCALSGFAAGAYRLRASLSDHDEAIPEQTLELDPGRPVEQTVVIAGGGAKSGNRTLMLEVVNTRGDRRLSVVRFTNTVSEPDLFGQRVLNPRPKKIEWLDGEFPARRHTDLYIPRRATARTRRTARVFTDRYYMHTGVRLRLRPLSTLMPARGIVMRLGGAATFKGKPERGRREGYGLRVTPQRVVITGFDEPGLHYGGITFFQLMKNDAKIRDEMPVPCVEVLDWPDLHRRIGMTGHGVRFKGMPMLENRGIEYLLDWVDRFVARNKLNFFIADLSRAIVYKRHPDLNHPTNYYTLEDIAKLGEYCRDNFIEYCPAWQVGGHADWWLTNFRDDLRERGYMYQSDVTHPKHNRVVFDCMLDVIEAGKCKWATPKSDEWWGRGKGGEKRAARLRGKTRAQAFLDFHIALHNFLRSKGVRMWMFNDMLTPYSGGKKFDVYKVADRIPKDIAIGHWTNPEDLPYFAEKGFEIWRLPNGFANVSPAHRPYVKGYGTIIYGLGNDKVGGLLAKRSSMLTTYALMRAADYGWNIDNYPGDPPGRNISLRNLFALTPNPYASETVTPVDLGAQLRDSFSAYLKRHAGGAYASADEAVTLPRGRQTIAHVPMQLGAHGAAEGRDCLVLGKGAQPVSLPVRGRYSALVFLHTAFINNPKDRHAAPGTSRKWQYGYPCGEYKVRYADGTEAAIPIRLTMNVRRYNSDSKNRATNENRYVKVLHDANYDPVHLYQYEWVNPHPMKTIEAVSVGHPHGFDVSLIVFAVSGRGVWQTPALVRAPGR